MHRIGLVLLITMVTLSLAAQEGAGKCTLMDLTIQNPTTLTVLPALVEESLTLTLDDKPDAATFPVINVWLKVLNNSRLPDERLELYLNGQLLETRPSSTWSSWEGDSWHLWSRPALWPPADTDIVVEIKSFTRTDVPNHEPSVILVGALEIAGTALTGGPTLENSLAECVYSSPVNAQGLELEGVYEIAAQKLGSEEEGNEQGYTARLGGLGSPRLSASIRFGGGGEDTDAEGEDEGEVEGEGPSGTPDASVQLLYGDEAINGPVNALAMPAPFVEDVNAFMAGNECWRIFDYIPEHLYSIPLLPKIRISIDPNFPQAFLVVDDFTLTYVSPLLEMMDPEWIGAGNLIRNGGFEAGTYPFVIESPEGKSTCPMVSDVIRRIDDACSGDYAVVFRFSVPDAYIAYCDVERFVGKNQTGTLVIGGTELASINSVFLIPESYAGTGLADGNYILLIPGDLRVVGDMEEVRCSFSFSGPMNPSSGPSALTICTDGIARFECEVNGELKPGMIDCETLIDTIPPVLVIDSPAGVTNAENVSPSVTSNREIAPFNPWGPFATGWILDKPGTPKNAGSYAISDMHVYVNPGSRDTVPYSHPHIGIELEEMNLNVSARFEDIPPPGYENITLSSFFATTDEPSNPFSFPGSRRGTARWSGAPAYPTTLNSYTQNILSIREMEAQWRVTIPRSVPTDSWAYSFKPEATDRAGNFTHTSDHNTIWIHWLYRTQAKMVGKEGIFAEPPAISWKLLTPTLPETGNACRQLARFRLCELHDNGSLTPIASSPWLDGALRGDTMMSNSMTFLANIRERNGRALCLDVIGADETGNVQHFPNAYTGSGFSRMDLLDGEVDHIIWVPGVDNMAVDTDISIELFHEDLSYPMNDPFRVTRSFGSALRVPLPPYSQACLERVNGWVRFHSIVPTSGMNRAATAPRILWKFYRNDRLVATGVAGDNWRNASALDLLEEMLLAASAENNATPARLNEALDLDSLGSFWTRTLSPPSFLNTVSDTCGAAMAGIYNRLGDEGNEPNPSNLNAPSRRRDEIYYTMTAQTVFVDERGMVIMDSSPARVKFSIYPDIKKRIDTPPVREFSR